ncbi:MAG TPA: hypothetical protein VGS57_10105 [Thermoanaerobaculia bacterium]|nr:hypothetical protein [Thermoanaerobaculia bacterium]
MTQLIVRQADNEVKAKRLRLGLAARFARIGLAEDIPELRGQPARPADFGR